MLAPCKQVFVPFSAAFVVHSKITLMSLIMLIILSTPLYRLKSRSQCVRVSERRLPSLNIYIYTTAHDKRLKRFLIVYDAAFDVKLSVKPAYC